MKRECYVVTYASYEGDGTSYAFWREEDAKKSVDEDVATTKQDLIEQGYEPTELRDVHGNPEVYVPGSGIYYEWLVEKTTIE